MIQNTHLGSIGWRVGAGMERVCCLLFVGQGLSIIDMYYL